MYYYTIKSCSEFGIRDYCNIYSTKEVTTKEEIIEAVKANGGVAGFMIDYHAKDVYDLYAVRISFIKYYLDSFIEWLQNISDSI